MLDLLFANAMATTATTQAAAQPNPIMGMAPFIIIFGIFYFLMIRPQKKKMEKEQLMVAALGKGDEVFTKSGIIGTIIGLTDKIVTLEIAEGVKMKVVRAHLAGLASNLFEKKKDEK